jgi:hypothetical protein
MTIFQQRLESAYPSETYANTLRALREGIASADDTMRGIPMLTSVVGEDYRGLIRRAGIIHRFAEMCKAGDLPFRCSLSPMPRGTWHWLDIYSGETHGHIVRTEDPIAFPEDTPNRQDARASNMPDLFETEDERIIRLSPAKLYTWLCYRPTPAGQLFHALWQAPSANANDWLARINLMAAPMPKKVRRPQTAGRGRPKGQDEAARSCAAAH